MLGIVGWEPDLLGSAEALVARHATRLASLVGRRLDAVWLLHGPDGWLPDAPVVLVVGGDRLEVCAWQLDLSLTWDVIDLGAPAYPTADRHDWRPDARRVVGAVVTGLDVVENSYSVRKRDTGEVLEGWLLSGLRLRTDAGSLTVFNALDQNGIVDDEGLDGVRYREVPTTTSP